MLCRNRRCNDDAGQPMTFGAKQGGEMIRRLVATAETASTSDYGTQKAQRATRFLSSPFACLVPAAGLEPAT